MFSDEMRGTMPQWSSLILPAAEQRRPVIDEMTESARNDGRTGFFVSTASGADATATNWGESVRVRVSSADTLNATALLDYAAPARFGPPRHVHRNDDETFIIESGKLAIWTPSRADVARVGDVVYLPKHVPHAWRSCNDEPVRFRIIASPGEIRHLIPALARRMTKIDDWVTIAVVASDAGMEILGPPLSDEEVAAIAAKEAEL